MAHSKDRSEEALVILVKYNGEGNLDDAFVQAEYTENSWNNGI